MEIEDGDSGSATTKSNPHVEVAGRSVLVLGHRFLAFLEDPFRSWVTDSSARRYEGAPCLAEPESCPTTLLSDSSSSHSILLFCFLFLFLLLSHSTLVFVRKNWQRECGLAFDARN